MDPHPVELHVQLPESMQRVHVAIRLVLLMAIGALGLSSLYWALYLGLPAAAALYISSKGGARYLADDGPTVARALGWLARAYAYLWLLTDTFPSSADDERVALHVTPSAAPTTATALLRLVYSLPALIVLSILSFAASVLWVVGALVVLVRGRLPHAIGDFLTTTLQYQFRLVAYHLSIVDRYPSLQTAASSGRAAATPAA